MKQLTNLQLSEVKRVRNRALIPFGLFVIFHIFMVQYIFPIEGDLMRIYVPSRTGGSSHFLSLEEFLASSMTAIIATAIAGLLILLLSYLKTHKLVLIIGFILFSLTAFRLSVQLSAALGSLWGDLGQVIGFVSMLAVWAYLVWPIMTTGLDLKFKKKS